MLWVALVPLGLAAYLLFWQTKSGDALAPLRFQSLWQREWSFPLSTLVAGTVAAAKDGSYWLIDWLVVVPGLLAAAYATVRFRPAFSVHRWLGILIPLSLAWHPRPLMQRNPING